MAASLYRKYRPQRFAELVGQEHVAKAIQNAISEDRLAHAYLFSGTRGTGKTSSARILGAVLNCQTFRNGFPKEASEVEPCGECESCLGSKNGTSFDVIELDAASNNGVDDMRDLIEKVSYTSAAGGTKVYIIDEVHELTGRAANALLKTLEEPPEHVVFILATTNPEKVLPTIRSRTQHFEFVSLPEEKLFAHAKDILEWEEKELDEEVIHFVAQKGAGSVRDMLSYLDQVLALEVKTMEELNNAHASNDSSVILELIQAASSGNVDQMFQSLHLMTSAGKEPRAIVENIISVARDCLVVSLNPNTSVLLSNHNDKDELKAVGEKCGTNFLKQFILKLGKAVADMRGTASLNPLLNVEMALLSSVGPQGVEADPIPGSVLRNRSLRNEERTPKTVPSSVDPGPAPISGSVLRNRSLRDEAEPGSTAKDGGGTLGALKRNAQATSSVAVKEKEVETKTAPKLTVKDISASWPKVVALLSVASQEAVKKATPIKLEEDVLTFGVKKDELEEVKARFKKDASIIRGFLESLHEQSFRFKLVEHEVSEKIETQDEEIDIRSENEKLLAESQEYDPVENVVSMFGGEVVNHDN